MGTDNGDEKIFRVSSNTPTKDLGAAIAHAILDNKTVCIRAVGHGAIGQAGKGIAVAEGHVARHAVRLKTNFGFFTTPMPDKKEVSGLLMRVVRD
ncbi:stage V sporulation protein S [Streptomyces luteogriseus]|jgi:stage V sporulation protein SpoVS|uniref:stage V sporulation protein S n=1 Tax=Streptomyces luteogriseus TaxID=68233 RepID=UPI0037A28A46